MRRPKQHDSSRTPRTGKHHTQLITGPYTAAEKNNHASSRCPTQLSTNTEPSSPTYIYQFSVKIRLSSRHLKSLRLCLTGGEWDNGLRHEEV